jgi:ubiquinone/menaquinone biosynthesis C-methylase UbiE
MMPNGSSVVNHYAHGSLLDAIQSGVQKLGKTINNVRVEDLGPVDEFHIGGRIATEGFLDQLNIGTDHCVIDVGCGLGGGSRFAAQRYGCRVTGIDLSQEYVETGQVLCSWVGLSDRICLETADATALSHPDDAFDCGYMMHVGMNIADKQSLVSELHRVLRPGGKLGIYDVMRVGDGELEFPVPWATEPEDSAVVTPHEYKAALEAAGFRIIGERDRRDFALDFFAQMQAKAASAEGAPPLGLHILMGDTAPAKVKNMIENILRNLLAPVELIAEKAA